MYLIEITKEMIYIAIILLFLLICLFIFLLCKSLKKKKREKLEENNVSLSKGDDKEENEKDKSLEIIEEESNYFNDDELTLDIKEAHLDKKYQGKYEIFKEGEFYKYRLKASNGEVLCVSEIYSSEKGTIDAINNVKKNIGLGTLSINCDKNGLYTFTLKAKNGRPLIVSANYDNKTKVESAMTSFKRFALTDNITFVDEVNSSNLDIKVEEIIPQGADNEYNGKFVILEEEHKFSYILKASNGVIILRSDVYNSKASCINSIDVLKNTVETGKFYLSEDKRGQFQFKLYSDKNRLIVVGESYNKRQNAINAINSVKKFYLNAKIVFEKEENKE